MCGDAYDPAQLADAGAAGGASLGCGNPLAVAELVAGETVLDLGSGAGLDVLLSARRVGPDGFAYGLDMTDEMLDLARAHAAEAGATNVEFLRGHIEAIPLPDASVDVVISNCVINLSADKPAVFAEIARVLRPGGRVGVSDLVADDHADAATVAEAAASVGALTGVLRRSAYCAELEEAGLTEVALNATHEVAAGISSAIIRASRPWPSQAHTSRMDRQAVHQDLDRARATFHELHAQATSADLERRSHGTRWNNQQLLFHMLLGYLIIRALGNLVRLFGRLPPGVSRGYAAVLNAGTRPFNVANFLGSWAGGTALGQRGQTALFDRVIAALHRRLDTETDADLARGMHYPTRWDPFFTPYMTLADVYRFPTQHFDFHRGQLTLDPSTQR